MDLFTTKQAAACLGIKEQMVRKHLRSGALKGRHIGQTWVIDVDDLAEFAKVERRPGRKVQIAS